MFKYSMPNQRAAWFSQLKRTFYLQHISKIHATFKMAVPTHTPKRGAQLLKVGTNKLAHKHTNVKHSLSYTRGIS